MLRPAAVLLVVVLGAAAGCATPTLPLPPPAALAAYPPDADGISMVTGEVLPDAWVYCVNTTLEVGVIVRADDTGTFMLYIAADSGQYLTIYQEIGTENGPPVEIRVP